MLPLLLLLAVTSALGCELKPVHNLAATDVRSSRVKLSWSTPSAEDVECVRGYRICTVLNDSPREWCANTWNATISEYNFTNFDGCSQYRVSVVALGDNTAKSVPTYVTVTTAPGNVRVFGHARKDENTITVTWDYEPREDRTCAKEFQLTYCDVRQTDCTTRSVPFSGANYSVDFSKKRNCNGYALKMSVLDRNQQKSDEPIFIYPGPPDVVGVPENLRVTEYNSNSIDLEWTIPATQANCEYFVYVYTHSKVGNNDYGHSTLYEDRRNNHKMTNLTSCTAYKVNVDFGASSNEYIASTNAYTLPEGDKIFENVAVSEKTLSSLTVSWTTSLTNNQCIAVYTVCWRKKHATRDHCRNTTRDDSHFKLTSLEANTPYRVSVAALLETGVEYDKEIVEARTKSGHRSSIYRS